MYKAVKTAGYVLTIICLGVIFFFSFSSNVNIPEFLGGQLKIGHFLAYTAFGFLLFLCFSNFSRRRPLAVNVLPLAGAVLLASLCGYTIELCQPAFGRHFAVYDMLCDCAGALSGALLGFFGVFLVCIVERRRLGS